MLFVGRIVTNQSDPMQAMIYSETEQQLRPRLIICRVALNATPRYRIAVSGVATPENKV